MSIEAGTRPIDADNHYYESLDAFTRHQDPAMRAPRRAGRAATASGRYIVVADKINRFIPNPTFDPVIVPGCTELLFRGQIPDGRRPAYVAAGRADPSPSTRTARRGSRVMDEQGLAAALLFPTLGVGVEQGLRDDPEATMSCLSAFNRWLEEDWGFAYQDRIFAAPLLSLADPARRAGGARRRCSSAARSSSTSGRRRCPRPTAPRSFGAPRPRPGVGALAEAGVPVTFHLGDSGYLRYAAAVGRQGRTSSRSGRPIRSTPCSSTTGRSTTRWRR